MVSVVGSATTPKTTASKISFNASTGKLTATGIENTPIGATTPSTGAFTTLGATDNLTLSTGVISKGQINGSVTGPVAVYDIIPATGNNRLISFGIDNSTNGFFTVSSARANGSNNIDVASFTSAGAAITGTLSATSKISSAATTSNTGLEVQAGARIMLDGGGDTWIDQLTANEVRVIAGGAAITTTSSTGLAITGTLSATGQISTSATGNALNISTAGATALYQNIGNSAGNIEIGAITTGEAYVASGGNKDLRFYRYGSLMASITSAGLAVTGTLSATTGAAVGGATAGAGGLAFPATAVAVANGNTLDDYEESTWSPTFSGNTGTITYTGQSGYYTKIGNLVQCSVYVTCTGVAGTGTVTMSLPFTCQNSNAGVFAFNDAGHTIGVTSTADNPRMRTVGNSASLEGVKSLGQTTYLTYAELCSGGTLEFSIEFSYLANP
jgi:hypothetical protein